MKKTKSEEDISSKTEKSFYQPFQPSPIVCPFTQQVRIPNLTKSTSSSSIPNVVESVFFLALDQTDNKKMKRIQPPKLQNYQNLTTTIIPTKRNQNQQQQENLPTNNGISSLNNLNTLLTNNLPPHHQRIIHPPISPSEVLPNSPFKEDHKYIGKNGGTMIYNREYIGTSKNLEGMNRNLESYYHQPLSSLQPHSHWKSNSFFSREPYDFLRGSVFQQYNRYHNNPASASTINQDYNPLYEQMKHLNLDGRNPEFNSPSNASHHEQRCPHAHENPNESSLYVTDMLSTMGKQCLHFFVDHVSWLSKKRCPKRCRVYVIPEVRQKVDELFKTNFRWTEISIYSMWSTRQNNCKEIMHRHKHNSRHVIRNLIITSAPKNAF